MRSFFILSIIGLTTTSAGSAQEPLEMPKGAKPIPATRTEMKQALDALKNVAPRLPLPPAEGDKKGVNNGRMRAFYVPEELRIGGIGGFGKGVKEGEKTDYTFNTKLFWIVSRINNCQY